MDGKPVNPVSPAQTLADSAEAATDWHFENRQNWVAGIAEAVQRADANWRRDLAVALTPPPRRSAH